MFSPYYAWSRARGRGDPMAHCALNVALYGPVRRWAMTERGAGRVTRDERRLRIGPSALDWDGETLKIAIDEVCVPVPHRLRGVVRVRPGALTGARFALDPAGLHHWSPLAPASRVEVALERPDLSWSGPGYLDSNAGAGPLEASFTQWHWCRAPLRDGTAILYEASFRAGGRQCLALQVDRGGAVAPFDPPPLAHLPRTGWRVARHTRADGGGARVVRALEDAPFYARSVIDTHLLGEPARAVHESLSLDRFRSPVVQAMLAFRIPRAPW